MTSSRSLKPNSDSQPNVTGFGDEAVRNRLDLGSMDAKLDLCKLLVNSMPKANDDVDPSILTQGYAYAMADVSLYRLRQVVQELVSGRAGVKWLPMPNELGIMVREKMRFDIDYQTRKALEPVVYDETIQLSAEEIDRREKHVAAALKNFDAARKDDTTDEALDGANEKSKQETSDHDNPNRD